MTAIMYEKLFEPYSGDGHTIEATLKYLKKEALQRNISDDVVELAWNEVFAEIASGRKFSTEKCSCGCGINKAATDLIHTIRDRMFEIDKQNAEAVKGLMQKRYQLFLTNEMKRISKFDKELEHMVNGTLWERLTDWPASPVYCLFKGGNYKLNRATSKLARIQKYKNK